MTTMEERMARTEEAIDHIKSDVRFIQYQLWGLMVGVAMLLGATVINLLS